MKKAILLICMVISVSVTFAQHYIYDNSGGWFGHVRITNTMSNSTYDHLWNLYLKSYKKDFVGYECDITEGYATFVPPRQKCCYVKLHSSINSTKAEDMQEVIDMFEERCQISLDLTGPLSTFSAYQHGMDYSLEFNDKEFNMTITHRETFRRVENGER